MDMSWHPVVGGVADKVTSTKYRPQAGDDKQWVKATLDEKSQLLAHMENVKVKTDITTIAVYEICIWRDVLS